MTRYLSYLLRIWSIDTDGQCRAMIEHIGSGVRVSFTSLESLVDFLREQAQMPAGTAPVSQATSAAGSAAQENLVGRPGRSK